MGGCGGHGEARGGGRGGQIGPGPPGAPWQVLPTHSHSPPLSPHARPLTLSGLSQAPDVGLGRGRRGTAVAGERQLALCRMGSQILRMCLLGRNLLQHQSALGSADKKP